MGTSYFLGLLFGTIGTIVDPYIPPHTCNSSVTATAPDSRYTDNLDGTITDTQTGLMWKQCLEGRDSTTTACDTGIVSSFSWQAALQQAQTVNNIGFAGHTDWRLPNRNELNSLVERSCSYPAINIAIFPDTDLTYAWTSSPEDIGYAWRVSFNEGNVTDSNQVFTSSVRLVRGGL